MNFGAIWPKNRFLKKILRPIVNRILDQFFFRTCQKKHNKWVYNILKEFVKKNKKIIGFRERQTVTNYVTVLKYTDRVNIMNPKFLIAPK